MAAPRRRTRLILRCRLCAPGDGQLVEPSTEHAYLAAVDHAIDTHRQTLLDHPDIALGALSVAA